MLSKTASILVPALHERALYLFEFHNIEEVCMLVLSYFHLKALIAFTANHNEGPHNLLESDTETREQLLHLGY